jgi:hypothetical protein
MYDTPDAFVAAPCTTTRMRCFEEGIAWEEAGDNSTAFSNEATFSFA